MEWSADLMKMQQSLSRLKNVLYPLAFSKITWWIAFAFLLIPSVEFRNRIADDIDSSYIFLQNYLVHTPYLFGKDVVFTYGPLGFLILHLNYHHNLIWAIVFSLFLWGLVIGGLWFYLTHYPQHEAFPLAFVLLAWALTNNIYYVFLFFFTAQALLFPKTARYVSFCLLLLYAVVMVFVKLDIGISTLLICMVILLAYILQKEVSPFQGILLIAVVPILFALSYWMYNPSWGDLWTYVKSGLDLSGEYAAVLSAGEAPIAFRIGIGFLMLWLLMTGWLFFRRQLQTGFLFLLGSIQLWFSFKHGFIRQDFSHWIMYFEKIPVLCGTTSLFVSTQKLKRWVVGVGLVMIGVMVWFQVANGNGRRFLTNLYDDHTVIFRLSEAVSLLRSSPVTEIPPMPSALRSEIGNRSVTIFPWALSRVFSDRLNYVPMFVPQSYQAYTAFLDRQTATHLEAGGTVPEFVLFDWMRIDDRHPFLDVPYTWLTFYKWYDARRCERQLYLVRRATPRFQDIQTIEKTIGRFGDWVDLPKEQRKVTIQCNLKKSLTGRLVNAAYRLPPVMMEVAMESGLVVDLRVPPDVLKNPTLMDCLPMTEEDVLAVMAQKDTAFPDRILRFRLHGEGARFYQEPFDLIISRLR